MSLRAAAFAAATCAATSIAGCATILQGTTQRISISSNPPGAKVVVAPSGVSVTTPAEADLARGKLHTVHFELEGYEAQNAYIYRERSGATYGNLVIGGIIGFIIDLESGAAYDLTPSVIHVKLQRQDPQPSPPITDR